MSNTRRLPRLCQRKSPSSGKTLAYATFNGRMVSFGPDGPKAQRDFESFLASWLAAGRRLPDEGPEENPFTVGQLIDTYLDHLKRRHPAAWLANNYARIELSTRPLRELFGPAAAREFSPKKLAAVRERMIAVGSMCRREINERVRILRKMFKWACAEELVAGEQAHALAAVDPLRRGDFGTRESRKVLSAFALGRLGLDAFRHTTAGRSPGERPADCERGSGSKSPSPRGSGSHNTLRRRHRQAIAISSHCAGGTVPRGHVDLRRFSPRRICVHMWNVATTAGTSMQVPAISCIAASRRAAAAYGLASAPRMPRAITKSSPAPRARSVALLPGVRL